MQLEGKRNNLGHRNSAFCLWCLVQSVKVLAHLLYFHMTKIINKVINKIVFVEIPENKSLALLFWGKKKLTILYNLCLINIVQKIDTN